MKVVLLIWYSNKNFGFRKIESYLASKIDFEIWKCPIFASSASNCLTRYEQILLGCSLEYKNALNFTCLPMKFHNRGRTTVDLCSGLLKLHLADYCTSKETSHVLLLPHLCILYWEEICLEQIFLSASYLVWIKSYCVIQDRFFSISICKMHFFQIKYLKSSIRRRVLIQVSSIRGWTK